MNVFEEFMIGFKARHPEIFGYASYADSRPDLVGAQDAILAPDPRRVDIAPVKPVTASVAQIPVVSVPLEDDEEEWDAGESLEEKEKKPEEFSEPWWFK